MAAELVFCLDWVVQKERVLRDKRGRLKRLKDDIASGRYGLCFGAKKLLAQRQTAQNAETPPFASQETWRAAWDNARKEP